ncbi:hypothetical protein A374_08614 [Fictibacillus macauensis ZFHKF-1]|uniref:Uncharacterized protein n=1 Tax=Fictibacillus macauensis ZFHKF-1 TaxID=1196324 RepID=I8AK08_9BACL|nr:hypothetical protein [Fictibacillus macauensis]EIT85884.1 hypothetical protein A374_08614 [Fictibacillus macauensis ZFHKF-1]
MFIALIITVMAQLIASINFFISGSVLTGVALLGTSSTIGAGTFVYYQHLEEKKTRLQKAKTCVDDTIASIPCIELD